MCKRQEGVRRVLLSLTKYCDTSSGWAYYRISHKYNLLISDNGFWFIEHYKGHYQYVEYKDDKDNLVIDILLHLIPNYEKFIERSKSWIREERKNWAIRERERRWKREEETLLRV